jgi:hypothetical protein
LAGFAFFAGLAGFAAADLRAADLGRERFWPEERLRRRRGEPRAGFRRPSFSRTLCVIHSTSSGARAPVSPWMIALLMAESFQAYVTKKAMIAKIAAAKMCLSERRQWVSAA